MNMVNKKLSEHHRGFTLVEIMIVVVLIGLLATLAYPAIQRAQETTQNSRIINDFRIFANAFSYYSMEHGVYPPDGGFDPVPTGMDNYLPSSWLTPPAGGQWLWDQNDWGVTAAVSYHNSSIPVAQMAMLDAKYDDGDLTTGVLQRINVDRLSYVIEP